MTDDGIVTIDDLWPEIERLRDESTARGPMTGVPPTWDWLVEQEPALGPLLERCRRLANPRRAYDHWYGRGGLSGIRHELAGLVGWGRRNPRGHPDLYGPDAYDLAYETLLTALGGR